MDRDFAYKDRVGKGVIQSKKQSLLDWKLILLVVLFCLIILAIFVYVKYGWKNTYSTESATESPVIEQQIKDPVNQSDNLADDERLSNTNDQDADITSDDEFNSLQFYELLGKPLTDDYSSDSQPREQLAYRVESGLIRNKVNARSLKALLVFEGFRNVRTEKVTLNGQQWYRLVIEPISSKSKMHAVRDFLGSHDLDSEYSQIK